MNNAEKIRIFLTKLQNLPENKKKIILWTIVAVLGLTAGFFWVRSAINNFSKMGESVKSIKMPTINLPDINILQTTTPSSK